MGVKILKTKYLQTRLEPHMWLCLCEACCLLCTVANVLRFSRIGQKPVNETGLQGVTNRPCWCFIVS